MVCDSKSQHARLQLFVESAQLELGAGWDNTDIPPTNMEQKHLQNVHDSIDVAFHVMISATVSAVFLTRFAPPRDELVVTVVAHLGCEILLIIEDNHEVALQNVQHSLALACGPGVQRSP
jgi:hypothetical protein